MKTLKGAFALLILTGLILVPSVNLFAQTASAYADFSTWSTRSTRVNEPVGYNDSGCPTCRCCQFSREFNDIGNLGIGNGNYTLMKPAVMNDMIGKAFDAMNNTTALPARAATENASLERGNNITGNGAFVPQRDVTKNATDVSGSCPTCGTAAAEEAVTESLVPNYIMAGGVIHEGTPDSITVGRPFPHILNEGPTEAGVIYGKLLGLPMPDGRRMDVGVKCPGYEY